MSTEEIINPPIYRYEMWVVGYSFPCKVIANYIRTTTNGSSSSGYYAFYKDKTLVACYPIDRTIIQSITEI